MKKNMKKLAMGLIATAILTYLFIAYILTPMNVNGISMAPTLDDNQRIWVNQAAFAIAGAEYGDIVVLIDQEDNGHKIVKRVVGKPSDRIEYRENVLYRNGVAVSDVVLPADHEDAEAIAEPVVLGDDEYYVLGDNLSDSVDSRVKGAFSSADFVGKVLFE